MAIDMLKAEIAAMRHETRMAEMRCRREMETKRTWRPVRRACVGVFWVNFLAEAGVFYWFARLLGH
jgi:hypothetical protein